MINGLVLQGGGALGAFELGVIEWLLDHGIEPDVVSGVSMARSTPPCWPAAGTRTPGWR